MSQPHTIDVEYVANLARIALTDEEKKLFAGQLGQVLTYIEKLNTLDVSNVKPMAHAFPVTNVWGDDVAVDPMPVALALKTAPALRDNMIVVPKVVE
jgi:aspartyl-tRNA(Asn)/glutamyl-tRNA(Gln) amidotransferase subunit C